MSDLAGSYLLDRKDLRDWHYDHEGRRSGDHQPHCGFQAPVPGRAWTHCVCFGAAARAVEPLLAELEIERENHGATQYYLVRAEGKLERLRDTIERYLEAETSGEDSTAAWHELVLTVW